MTKNALLIVDDDEDIRTQLKWALTTDYEVAMAGDRAAAVTAFRTGQPMVTLLDLGLPPRAGARPAAPGNDLARQRQVTLRARAHDVVQDDGLAEAGGLGQPDRAWYEGVIHPRPEVPPHLGHDLLGHQLARGPAFEPGRRDRGDLGAERWTGDPSHALIIYQR